MNRDGWVKAGKLALVSAPAVYLLGGARGLRLVLASAAVGGSLVAVDRYMGPGFVGVHPALPGAEEPPPPIQNFIDTTGEEQ